MRRAPDGERIASEVRELMAELEAAGDFLETSAGAFSGLAQTIIDQAPVGEMVGSRIGPYQLLERIGEGGFGAVYLAEQEHPIRRRVALKIIKLGMDTRQVISRFEQERQVLAILDHPCIAKVLDAGATEAGRPYFVMELVRGVPITQYCDEHGLSVRARLELFEEVCGAVQHAHQKGIIHRDIKPTNVLVGPGDGDRPVLKVIDFGIAKATQARLAERTLFTEHRQFLGTPEYMSPEQAGFDGAWFTDVDTRTDVYSLGVLLYELLTGVTPFDPTRLRSAAFDELRRIIREVDPPRPSTRLSTMNTLGDVAARRHTEPARLRESVRGELDWIVMRCLEKDRTRRYASAADLGRDIERHLNYEALEAGPPTVAYRARKFVRRHRRTVAVSLALVGLLVLGLVGTTISAIHAVHARNDAILAEGRALKAAETETAERVRADAAALEARRLAYSLSIGLASTQIEQGTIGQARAELAATPPELRGWEWSHLAWACDPVSRSFDTPRDTESLVLSGDGTRLLTRARSGDVRVFDAATTRLLHTLKTAPGRSWRFHMPQADRTGSLLLTHVADDEDGWTGDGTVTLWDVTTGKALWVERTTTLLGASFAGGRWRRSDDGAVRLDIRDDVVLDRAVYLKEPLDRVYGPIGNSRTAALVVADAGWNVLWDLDAQREISRFGADSRVFMPGPPEGVIAVTTDRVVQIDARAGTTRPLPIARNAVSRARGGGGRAFGLQSPQGVVQTFSWPDLDPLFKVNIPKDTDAAFAVDSVGTTAYVIGELGVTQARTFASGQPFRVEVTWRGGYAPAICPTGRRSALVGWGSVCAFDTQTGENLWSRYPGREAMYAAAFSADGRRLAVAGAARAVTIFDAATGDTAGALALPDATMVTSLAWSPAGDRLLAGLWDGRILEFDPSIPDAAPKAWPEPASSSITLIAFSPEDDRVLVVARSGMKLKDYHHPTPGTEQVVRVRDARGDHATLSVFPAKDHVRAAAFAPDGRSIAVSADDSVLLMDAATAHVHRYVATSQPGEAIAFSPDGNRLAVVCNDELVRIFSADSLTLAASLKCVTWSNNRSAAFSPDGGTLIVADPSTPVIAYESGPIKDHERRLSMALARGVVDRAFVRSDFVADRAREAIATDLSLPQPVRAAALDLTLARGNDPNQIHSTTLLRVPSTSPGPAWAPLAEQMNVAVGALPNDLGLRVTLALTQLRAGNAPEAAATAQVVINGMGAINHDRCVWAWTILALARSEMHDQESAREALRHALAMRDALANGASHSLKLLLAEAQNAVLSPDAGDPER
ncbi:MAG: protein kinase [Phycisphaerales bacterium]|nr:protein kinase [Phycisphaerales bacterium]